MSVAASLVLGPVWREWRGALSDWALDTEVRVGPAIGTKWEGRRPGPSALVGLVAWAGEMRSLKGDAR